MRRSIRLALIAMPLIALACGEDQTTAPTPPQLYVANAATITQQITDLYPEYLGHRDAALSKWRSLQDAIAKDKPSMRMKLMHLIDWTLKREKEGVLLDPNGPNAPSTRVAVSVLTASLYQAVYPDAPAPPIVAEGVDIGAGVVEPTMETIIVTEQSQAGGEFQTGTWTEPVLVTFTELPDPSPGGGGPLPAGRLPQYPKFYEITAFPNDPTLKDIRIGICHVTDPASPYFPPEPHTQLRVAKTKEVGEATELLILDRVEVADFLNCVDVSAEGPVIGSVNTSGLGGFAMRTIGKAVKGLASIITPKPLYAIDQGIGGVLERTIDDAEPTGGFSTFGLVDVNAQVAACATPVAGYTTYPTIAAAIAATTPGGTTFICNGTYVVDNQLITKPITVRSFPGGSVTIQHTDDVSVLSSFYIDTVPEGTVRISGLNFQSPWLGIWAQGEYDQVVVDSSSFVVPLNGVGGVYATTSTVAGAKVTVHHSSFDGGETGTFAHDAHVDVLFSTFANQTFSGIQHQQNSSGLVQYNTLSNCGPQGCIRSRFVKSMQILDNDISATPSRRIRFGIVADTGPVVIQRNDVIGYAAQPDPETVMSSDPFQYPITDAGIIVGLFGPGPGTATVSHNRIRGAFRGVFANSGSVIGSNMTMDSVGIAFAVGPNSSLTIGESDVHTYYAPFAQPPVAMFPSTLILICNYWGTTAGNPYNVPDDAGTNVFIPWATAPIANGGGGLCNGDFGAGCTICSAELQGAADMPALGAQRRVVRRPESVRDAVRPVRGASASSAAMTSTTGNRPPVPPLQ